MAISKIKPRHASEGRSIAAVLKDRIDYDKNPDKTKGGLLVSSYQCDPDTAWQEFALSKQIYETETGRKRAPENDVISYLIVQSFKPGEITPEDANKLGYQLALEFTGGQHQFLVATHVDKKHIHCHIEFNSTALDCSHKFNNYWNTYQTIRKINDRLSREHGLSVIEKPKEKGKHYSSYKGGLLDEVMRILCDILMAFPLIVIAMALVSAVDNSVASVIIAIGISMLAWFLRMVRSYAKTECGKEYIEAARISGASGLRIVLRHLIPNVFPQFVVYFTTGIATAIMSVSSFAFLGVGLIAGTPEWGAMLNEARNSVYSNPALLIYPGICLIVCCAGFNLLGEGLRDAIGKEDDICVA